MRKTHFIRYKIAGGDEALVNPECISHISTKNGFTVVTMRNGHEFYFDMTAHDFIEQFAKDMANAGL